MRLLEVSCSVSGWNHGDQSWSPSTFLLSDLYRTHIGGILGLVDPNMSAERRDLRDASARLKN